VREQFLIGLEVKLDLAYLPEYNVLLPQ